MTKILKIISICTLIVFLLTACNDIGSGGYQHLDTVRKFDKAIISLPNGEIISGNVEKWRDFEDGDQLQVKIDGTWYLVHSSNAVLISYSYEQP